MFEVVFSYHITEDGLMIVADEGDWGLFELNDWLLLEGFGLVFTNKEAFIVDLNNHTIYNATGLMNELKNSCVGFCKKLEFNIYEMIEEGYKEFEEVLTMIED